MKRYKILTWVPSIPLIGFLETFELDALKIPPDLLFMITASEVDVKLSLATEPLSNAGHPFEFPELPPILSGINGSIDSVTIELRQGSSSSCTIFVEFTEEVTFLGLKIGFVCVNTFFKLDRVLLKYKFTCSNTKLILF